MSTAQFEKGLETRQARQLAAYQREIDDDQRRQIADERAEREAEQAAIDAEIDDANNAPLFNIPAATWRENWKGLYNDASGGRSYCLGFWSGVHSSMRWDDPNAEDANFLLSIAIKLRTSS